MNRVKNLKRYQKVLLLVMAVMTLVFSLLYPRTLSRVGFAYKGAILVPATEGSSTVYSGKLGWQEARFTVSEDKVVVLTYGDQIYGPYTAIEDVTAVPKNHEMAEYMTGVELHEGEDILFRGGFVKTDYFYMLYNEDGTSDNMINVVVVTSDGVERDENGNVIDPVEPSVSEILELMNGPELTHHGVWQGWLAGALLCIFNALSILYAEDLFRFHLSFRIRNVDAVEPSEWELAGRYISWTAIGIMALVIFVVGLR